MKRNLADDGLYAPEIKEHSLEKVKRHDILAHIFAKGMSALWPQRAYIGLYAGSGRSRLPTGEIVETSALGAVREPFTHYIFVDENPACMKALRDRVDPLLDGREATYVVGDVNRSVGRIRRAMPTYSRSKGLLSLCFVDPFDASIEHSTIAGLAAGYRMDFLTLLALGMDARRNLRRYMADESDDRIAHFVDCPSWREELGDGANPVGFLLRKFNDAMMRLGYLSASESQVHPVKVHQMGVLLYLLVLHSKDPKGAEFWEKALKSAEPQLGLGI